jgi:hypothetical protein
LLTTVQILAGTILFDSSNFAGSFKGYIDGVAALESAHDLPPELELQPIIINTPMGRAFGILFFWASQNHELGRKYLEKVTALAPLLMNQVSLVTMSEFLAGVAAVIPNATHSHMRTLSVRRMTPTICEIIAKYNNSMSNDFANGISIHQIRSTSPSCSPKTSLPAVFGAREPHYLVEMIGGTVDGNIEETAKTADWVYGFEEELIRREPDEILDCRWVPLSRNELLKDLDKLFGKDNSTFVKELKEEQDPNGIFKYAIPRLTV